MSHRYPSAMVEVEAVNLTTSGHLVIHFGISVTCDTDMQSCARPSLTQPRTRSMFLVSGWQKFTAAVIKCLYLPQLESVFEIHLTCQLMSLEANTHVAFPNPESDCAPCLLPCIFEPYLLLFHPLTMLLPEHSSRSTEHRRRLTCAPTNCSASLSH